MKSLFESVAFFGLAYVKVCWIHYTSWMQIVRSVRSTCLNTYPGKGVKG
jgi:hypothetical protein